MAEYLTHMPPGEQRRLLDAFSAVGETFSDWHAAADLGLDLDRMRHPNPALRLRKLHSRRYYAERWGWTRARVQEAFAGDERRGVRPWIVERAAVAIGRPTHVAEALVAGHPADNGGHPADSGGQGADSGGQKPPRSATSAQIGGQVADSGGHSADKEEHYLRLLQKEEDDDRARGVWRGELPGPVDVDALGESAVRHRRAVEAAAALTDAQRVGWACRVLRAGQMPGAERLRDLGERAARHGPAALVVALAIADHAELRSPAYGSRLRYLDTTLEALSDHARRSRTVPQPARRAGGTGHGAGSDSTADRGGDRRTGRTLATAGGAAGGGGGTDLDALVRR